MSNGGLIEGDFGLVLIARYSVTVIAVSYTHLDVYKRQVKEKGEEKMILAKGKIAKKPYELSYLGQNIYSIEELCYVIYHNIYGINEEFFQISLAKWMKEELGLKELAEKLEAMIVGEHGLKDLVVTTLCGCDYYNEEEIRGIVKVLDEIDHLPSYQKKKIKADNYVRTGHYGKAVMAYRKLLQGPDAISFTPEEYGDILHNEGIAHFYTCLLYTSRCV